MLVKVIATLQDGTIVIKKLSDSGEFPESIPIEGEQYTIYFEKVEPDKIPEFNS